MKEILDKAVVLIIPLLFPLCIFAQENVTGNKTRANANDRSPKVSLELSSGSYAFPGFLLDIAPLSKHPDKLQGHAFGFSARYHLKQGWSLGVEGAQLKAEGFGEWGKESGDARMRAENVTGSTTGALNLQIRTFTFFVEKEFLAEKRFSPYFRLGGGGGTLTSDFRGEFRGFAHELYQNEQIEVPISRPVSDHRTRTIPAVIAEAGLTIRINKHLTASGGGYWNTGYGRKGSLALRF